MLNQDDEEYKKRLEEAKRLRMSTGMITTNDYNSNNNSFTQTTDDDYQARLQEAKKLRNSVGMITSNDIESDNDRIKNKMNAVWNDTNNMSQNNIEDKTSISQINDKYGLGNIDLTNRQVVKNQDGSISTVRSISFQDDSGKEILIPTVVNGKIVSNDEAIQHYYKTGEYLGKFDTVEQANAYAEQLHKQQDSLYNVNSNQVSTLSVTPIRNTAKNAITSNTENSKRIVSAVDTNVLDKKLNEQYQNKNKNKNIFSFAKDLIASTVISAYSTIKGLGETIKENSKERIEMLNNMSDDEIKNLANYQYNANDITKRLITQPLKGDSTLDESKKSSIASNLARTKLYIEDLAQDVSRSSVNGLIGTINNVIDFFTAGKKKDMFAKVEDWSILNNSEKYGDYTSQEALSQHIQDDNKNLYLNTGTYNPVANNIGSAVVNVATTVFLSKVGLGDTASFVTSSALQSLGDTGSVEEATKSALSSYVFSKVLDSKIADDVSQKIYNGSEEVTRRISKINPELFDSGIKKAILDSFPSVSKTFSKVFVGKTIAGEVNSIMDKGSATYSPDSQVGILADALIFSTIYAGINGYGGVKYRLKAEKLSQNEAQNQVSQWYKTMGLDENKKYYSPDEMKKIYRNLAKKYHSDVTGGSDEAMANINIAYDGLVRYFNEGNVYKFGIETEPVKTESKASNSTSATSNTGLITIGDNEGYINTKDVMQTTLKNIAMSQIEDGIVVNKDNENRVSNFEKVKTIPFEVEGSKLPDIAPAVTIDEQGTIGIIDINSGTKLLDNVQDIGTAMKQTGDMLKNNDEGIIKRIEDEVWTTKFEAEQGIDQILGVIQNKAEELKGTSGTNEIEKSANLKASTSNYTNKENNLAESQNNKNVNALNMEDRTYSNVVNKNIKPYSEEHPEISQDIKDMAANFMEDLANSLPGKRYKAGDAWTGQKRSTTKELADFKDATGISWDKIGDVLNDIYEGKGNYALAKKMELELDQALSKGYRNIYGQTIMPNEEYLQKKGKIEGKNYLAIKDSGDVTDYTDSDFTLFMKKKVNRKVAENPNIEYNKFSSKLTMKEKNQIISEVTTWRRNQEDGLHYIDLSAYGYKSYIYDKQGNNVIPIKKVEGSQEFLNTVRKEIENGTFEKAKTINKWLEIVKNETKNNRSDNVSLSNRGGNAGNASIYSGTHREQQASNRTSIIKKDNSNELKDSSENESSFSMQKNDEVPKQNRGLTKTEFDNQGNPIAFKTAQFFKDSKVRNDNGNLMVMYHGTEANVGIPKEHWFNTFDIDKAGNHGNMLGNGFYFTSEKTHAEQYAHTKGNIYEVYLNIKKPLDLKNFSTGDLAYSIRNINPYIEADIYKKDGTIDGYKVREYLIKNGYDGIHSGNTYVAFYSNQIKNINNSNPTTSDDIRYLKKSATTLKTEKDNLGRSLSKQQQEYFKNSKVRDKNGKLKEVYHGTPYDFNIFKYDKLGENTSSLGAGFYFTDKKQTAEEYARDSGNLKQVYLDIEKPMSYGKTTMTKAEYAKFIKAIDKETQGNYLLDYEGIQKALMEYDYGGDDIDLVSAVQSSSGLTWGKTFEILRKSTGYDGVISEKGFLNNDETLYVAFNSNQIKNIDNKIPTSNEDIRYLKKTDKNSPVDENIQKELHNRIQNALLSKNSRKNTFLGTVSEKVAKKVKSLLGLDVSGRKHMLSDYDIRHIIKQHGNPEIEKSKGQIAITFEDIEKIPDIINNYDDLTKGSPNKNVFTKQMQDSIRYSKQYENNILYVVEVVPDESGVLNVKTMWKKTIETNKKNNSVSVSHDNNIALPYTSETKPNSSYSKDSISQNTENVNQESEPKEFDLEKSKTNIQREDSFIEQEIQKAIKNNDIDENIPLTKISDIVYDIEKYIGSDIELKHFRGRAYGIYKTNRDLIRVAEKSDLDTILHEFAHQLDYRLHLDKSELYSEIVTDKIQEDYANAPDDVQLDEGFAEVIRQYFTQPDIVEKEFPDTVKKINELRNNDKELDEFITKTQKKIYNYIHQTPEKRAKSNISFKEDSKISINDFKTKGIEKAITLLFDEDYALKKYTKLLYDIAGYPEARQISASQDPVIASRLRKGLAGAVDDMVKNGIIDLNTGERKSQGLSAIEDILKDENMTDFMNYLVSLRSIEVAEKELKSGIRYDDAKAVVEKYKNNKSYEKARKIIEQYNNALLDYAKDAGLYSKEDIDLIKQSWLTYVPFQRVIDKGLGKSQRATGNPLKTFRGSDREIINPLEGIIMNTVKIVNASSKNEVIRRFYNLGEEAQYTAGIYDVIPPPVKNVATEKLSDFKGYLAKQGVELSDEQLEKAYKIFYPDTRDNPNQLITSFMNNGERIYLQFKDENLYKIFTGMNRQEMNLLQKYVGFANSIFKAGTTGYNLAFAIPNILSDTQQAFVTSEANFIPLYSSIKGVYDTLVARGIFKSGTDDGQKMQKIYSLYLQSGASGAGRTSTYRKDIEQQLVDIYKKKYKDFGLKQSSIEQFKEIAGYVSEISEEATRFENFVLELNKNLTNKMSYRNAVESAAVSTRRLTQDFAIKGSLSKQINAFVPYFSARLGGYYNAYEKYESTLRNAQNKYWEVYNKNLEGKSEEELKNPETFEKAKEEANKAKMRIIAKPLLTILALLAFNTTRKAVVQDDKNIQELSEQKKMDNYVFPNPLNAKEVITAKKPQGALKDIINSAEFVQDLVTGNIEEEKVGDKFVSLISSILKNNSGVDDFSGLIPPIIKVPLEIATNKDWYFNSEIVKDNDLQNLKPEDQYYEYNTNLSIKLGKILKKSPAQIDFSIRNIFGQASYDLWSGFSSVFDFFEGNQKADMGASDKFILKRFFANPNNNSESVTDLYNKQDELTVKKNYNEITSDESKQLENIQDATSIISNINKKIKTIKNDSNLSSKEKGEQIYKLQQQRTDTARQALGNDLISSSSDEIESSGFYPRTSTLSSNGYSLTLTNEMKTEYEKLAYESYQKYSKQNIYSSEYLQKIKQNCKNYAKQVLMKKYQNKLVKSK